MASSTITVQWLTPPPQEGALLYRVGDAGEWKPVTDELPDESELQFAKVLGQDQGTLSLEAVDDPDELLHQSTDPSED